MSATAAKASAEHIVCLTGLSASHVSIIISSSSLGVLQDDRGGATACGCDPSGVLSRDVRPVDKLVSLASKAAECHV